MNSTCEREICQCQISYSLNNEVALWHAFMCMVYFCIKDLLINNNIHLIVTCAGILIIRLYGMLLKKCDSRLYVCQTSLVLLV